MLIPYEWHFDENRGFVFVTSLGVEYEVKLLAVGSAYFDGYPEIQSVSYEICFDTAQKSSSFKQDKRVGQTIVSIVKKLLQKGKVIVFVCDSMDKRQKTRHLLFQQWFNRYGDSFIKHDIELCDDGTSYYLSVIFDPKQNSNTLIKKAFQESINEYVSYKE